MNSYQICRRTVLDKKTGEEIILSPEDVQTIRAIQTGSYTGTEDPYAPWIDFFTHEKMIHPVTRRPEDKRSFIPSLHEKKMVSIVGMISLIGTGLELDSNF